MTAYAIRSAMLRRITVGAWLVAGLGRGPRIVVLRGLGWGSGQERGWEVGVCGWVGAIWLGLGRCAGVFGCVLCFGPI